MSADWYVGQKVVCVDGTRFLDRGRLITWWANEGQVYTIRSIFVCETYGILRFHLEEGRNPIVQWADGVIVEYGFGAVRFRPLVSQDTDISEFQAILDRLPKREAIDA